MPVVADYAYAEGFADDFSANSIRYSTDSFDNSSGISSVDYVNNSVRLSSSGDETGNGSINFRTQADTDRFEVDVSLSSDTTLVRQDAYSGAQIYVEGYFYNDTQQTSLNSINEGDVWVAITLGVDQFDNTRAAYCLRRVSDNGQWFDLGDFGSELCAEFEGSNNSFQLDTQYSISIDIDRAAKQMTVAVGAFSKTVTLSGEVFPPLRNEQRIQVWQNGEPGMAVANLHSISTDDYSDDFSQSEPILNRYRHFRNDPQSTAVQQDGKLIVSARSPIDDYQGNAITVNSDEGYIEAELTLLNESTIGSSDGKTDAFIQYTVYNDTTDGGFDGRTGDVRAQLYASQRNDGRSSIEYCLRRAEDSDNDERSGLLPNGDGCNIFPLYFERGRTYRVSIELDRTTPSVRFKVDEHVIDIPIANNIFAANDPRMEIGVDTRNGSYSVASFDNVRTLPNAVTLTESAEGLVTAPEFPEPIDPATIQADSSIAHPFDFSDYTPRLDFIDDFSGITTDLGFSTGRTRGEAGVAWREGALTLENNSFSGNDDGNWTEFYLNHATDSVEAVVSVSDETQLPPDDDAEAYIQIRAVFYNDTQDYGFNGQEGDMESVIRIRFQGDGRRSIDVGLKRRDENGRTQDDLLNAFDEVRNGLESIIPEYNQQYRIKVALDRENSLIRYSVDDAVYEYAIPTGIFKQMRLRTLVSVNHRGNSGVAVGRVYSIKTDTVDVDFGLVAPLLAPYEPTWNAFYPGRSAAAVDGRLRLEADGTLFSGRDPGVAAISASDYVGAMIELSSESDIQTDGQVHVAVHSMFYNDLDGGEQADSNIGRVFTAVRLAADASGARFVEYCAYRINSTDFSDSTQLLGDDTENCPRFTGQPNFDTSYKAYIKIDRDAATLTFGFGAETVVYDITTLIGATRPFHGVRVRTTDGSKVLAWVDELSFSEIPIPLADSESALIGSDSNPVSGGSGCSIASTGAFDPSLPTLATLSIIFMGTRRRRTQKPVCIDIDERQRPAQLEAQSVTFCVFSMARSASNLNVIPYSFRKSSVLTLLSLASVVMITGCATSIIKENPSVADLAPMEKPAQGSIRHYQINKKTGEERFYDKFEVRADGSYGGVNSEGCAYEAFGDLISPAVSWNNCGKNPKWNSGENRGIVKKGEIWPLQLGNTVTYSYTQINALGEEGGKPILKCKVIDQVNIDVSAGNYDVFKVRCLRNESNWSRTRMYYFSPLLGVELNYVNLHSSNGVEQDYEFIRSEAI